MAAADDIILIGAVLGGGLLLARSLGQGVGGALGATGQGVGGALGSTGQAIGSTFSTIGTTVNNVLTGAGGNNPFPANQGANQFNINVGQSWVLMNLSGISAHVGVGHVGVGGTFICNLWGQPSGGAVALIASQQFNVGNDGGWTGYSAMDIQGVGMPSGFPPLGLGVKVWADIVGSSGEPYTQAAIN